jgi:hypothetical protein
MVWLWLVLGCGVDEVDTGTVAWSGWVYTDSDTKESSRFTTGNVTFWPDPFTEGGELAGEQAYADYPGYWQVDVPPDTAVNVRITSDDTRPTVWAGDTPSANGNWFAGALFGATDGWLEDRFDTLMGDGDVWVNTADADHVLVLGAPADDTLGCEAFTVAGAKPACWSIDEDGVATEVDTGPVTWFAVLAAPGVVSVGIGAATEEWRADGGDVVMAWYLSEGG